MANIITTLFKYREDGTGLKKIRTDIAAADTATGKFKAGWTGAKQSIVANAGAIGLAVGTGLVAASAKAISSFQNLALSAGLFADATGLAVEDASRWVAVADDIGISSDAVAAAAARMNKAIGTGGKTIEKYGLELKRTESGAADVNATFLATIDVLNGIEDPTERARVASELFGRSYANIAELIFQDSDKIKEALAGVSDAQIIDSAEVQKARDMRAAIDELQDQVYDLSLAFGEYLVPALTTAIEGIGAVGSALDAIGIDKILDAISGDAGGLSGAIGELARLTEEGSESNAAFANSFKTLVEAEIEATGGLEAAGEIVKGIAQPWKDSTAQVDAMTDAFNRLAKDNPEAAGRVVKALQAVLTAAEGGNDAAEQWVDKWGLSDSVVQGFIATLYDQAGAMDATGTAATELADDVVDGMDRAVTATKDWRDSVTDPAIRNAFLNIGSEIAPVVDSMEDLEAAATRYVDAFDPVLKQLDDLKQKVEQEKTLQRLAELINEAGADDADREDVVRLLDEVLRLGDAYGDLDKNILTQVAVAIDQGSIDQATALIQQLVSGWSVNLQFQQAPRFQINNGGNSAPTAVGGTTYGVQQVPNVVNNYYPVAPTATQVTELERDFIYANGTRYLR